MEFLEQQLVHIHIQIPPTGCVGLILCSAAVATASCVGLILCSAAVATASCSTIEGTTRVLWHYCMHSCFSAYYHSSVRVPSRVLRLSSVASPFCQEGQSEKTFPIFASSSRFLLFSLIFPLIFSFFPDFWHFFRCQGWHSARPLAPPVATPLLRLPVATAVLCHMKPT